MGWFKRIQDGITTKSTEKKEIPEGAWHQCPGCKNVITSQQHAERLGVCDYCGHHDRVGSETYFNVLFDEGKYREVAPKITSDDPLEFKDTKAYIDRLEAAKKKTGATGCFAHRIRRLGWHSGGDQLHGFPIHWWFHGQCCG